MTSPDPDSTGGGSGDGGTLGTPSVDTEQTPPGHDQDETAVVSGGGLADTSADDGGSG